jgi:peptidoglycan/LPS O-acetylase OafA/YrhL
MTGTGPARAPLKAQDAVAAHHRRDIDGLRAIAVMGVILDHAGVSFLRSGHGGVDVFFVISGFLLGGIVAADLAAGQFSFRAFYARRARRILPALFTVILVTLPFAWALMTPDQLRYYGGGAFSTLIFLSNVWFFDQIDYFNPGAAESPLVHTWSLGVEEQFYIALPMLMVALTRFAPRALVPVIAAAALASFAAALLTVPEHPQAAFYLIHTRAWELLAGVLGALVARRLLGTVRPVVGEVLAGLGLAMVIGGLVAIPETADWPGAWTLVPVAGTALVLVFGSPVGMASRLLGLAPFVWVGLVSYSAYLWHQPILAFLGLAGERPGTPAGIAAVVAVTLLLSWASWALVEQPFRQRRLPPRIARPALALAAAAIAAFAIGGHVTKGYPGRLPEAAREALAWSKSQPSRYWECVGGRAEEMRLDPAAACVHGAEAPPRVAVWGDSHGAAIGEALGQALAPRGIAVRELTAGGCMPVSGVVNSGQSRATYCPEHNAKMLDYMVADPDIEVVVIESYWNYFIERRDFDNRVGQVRGVGLTAYPLGTGAGISDAERAAYITERLRGDIARLTGAGKAVLLSYPLPEPGFDVPEWMARQVLAGRPWPETLGFPEAAFEDYSRLARGILDGVGEMPGLTRIDLSAALCEPGGDCRVIENGEPLYFDDDHLSRVGVARVMPALAAAVGTLLDEGPSGQP